MMAQAPFDRFYHLVLQDVQLQETLREITDGETFVRQVVALGETHGLRFSEADVTVAMQTQRRAWNARWPR